MEETVAKCWFLLLACVVVAGIGVLLVLFPVARWVALGVFVVGMTIWAGDVLLD